MDVCDGHERANLEQRQFRGLIEPKHTYKEPLLRVAGVGPHRERDPLGGVFLTEGHCYARQSPLGARGLLSPIGKWPPSAGRRRPPCELFRPRWSNRCHATGPRLFL